MDFTSGTDGRQTFLLAIRTGHSSVAAFKTGTDHGAWPTCQPKGDTNMISTNPHTHALHRADELDQTGQLSTLPPLATGDQAGRHTMINPVESQLSVLLRQTQWLLDDAAYDIPAGRYHQSKRDELANVLEYVAGVVRATTSTTMINTGDDQ